MTMQNVNPYGHGSKKSYCMIDMIQNTKKMPMEEVKSLIWRYFMSYWNNRRICSMNGGLPPMIKRKKFYEEEYDKTA